MLEALHTNMGIHGRGYSSRLQRSWVPPATLEPPESNGLGGLCGFIPYQLAREERPLLHRSR